MNIRSLQLELEKKYSLVCFIDVADITNHPGSLIKVLKTLYKARYNPSQRLVFYTSQEVSDDLIAHFYDTVNFVDISNFFVLFVTAKNIQSKLNRICITHCQDSIAFTNKCYNLEQTKKLDNKFLLPKTICAIPWNHIHVANDGSLGPCCVSKNYKFGNIRDVDLNTAFHSEKMQHLRQQFLNGEKPDACRNCWKLEDQGLTSLRITNTKQIKEKFLTQLIDKPKITSLDIKFGNLCNFKCRICGPAASSLFNAEQHKHNGIPMIEQSKWAESKQFYNQIIQLLPQIDNIDMYGGEPFLIKKFEKVLEIAVQNNVAQNIRLHYNSNGSIYPDAFIKWWRYFKQVEILFSIDNIGQRFQLERGGNWKEVETNILKLKNCDLPNLTVNIMPTVGAMNVFYLDELYDWAMTNNLQIFVNYVRSSKGFELKDLPDQLKKTIADKFVNHPWVELQNIAKMMNNLPESDGTLFKESVEWFDKIRKQNFAKTHPEIAQALGYTVQ